MPHRTAVRFVAALPLVLASARPASADPPSVTRTGEEATPPATETGGGARAQDGRFHAGALIGVGFPRPIAVEGFAAWRWFVLGAEYGSLPSLSIAGAKLSMWSASVDGRVFPFRGPFFVGLRAGRQVVNASVTVSALGQSATGEVDVRSWFVNPRVGLLWTWNSGLALGLEAGVQIPVGTDVSSTIPSGVDDSATSVARTYGKSVIPSVDLLRVGFML